MPTCKKVSLLPAGLGEKGIESMLCRSFEFDEDELAAEEEYELSGSHQSQDWN